MEALSCPIARAAGETPEVAALLDAAHGECYAALDRLAHRAAGVLRAKGIGPGDVLALDAHPDVATLATLIAARRVGAWTLPLNPKAPEAEIARAEALGAQTLFLLSNRRSEAAIHLYEKAGFRHDAEIMARYGPEFSRCDVAMRYRGGGDG